MSHVLALPGSIRRGSYNRLLLAGAADGAPVGMTVSLFEYLSAVPQFSEDLKAHDVLPVAVIGATSGR